MKLKRILLVFVSVLILSACNYSQSESGKAIDYKEDTAELQLAKKSLMFIQQQKLDSLINIFNEETLETISKEDLSSLLEDCKKIIDSKKYPNDSSIIVTHVKNQSITGAKVYKEFLFPFENEIESNTSEFIKIVVKDNSILGLLIRKSTIYK